MCLAHRVAHRYFEAHRAKPTTVPEGSSASDVGVFRLIVGPDKLKYEKAATKALEETEAKFHAARLILRGRVNVVLTGAVRRSYFSPMEGLIRLSTMNLNADGIGTLVHESTHWQHTYHLPGGLGNQKIVDKYAEAMRIKSAPGSGSSSDQALRKLNIVKKKIKELTERIEAPPEMRKGQIFTMNFGGVGPMEMQITRVLSNGAKAKFLHPTDVTNKYWPSGEVKLEAQSLRSALGNDAENERLKQERAKLYEESNAAYAEYKEAEKKGEDRIDGVLNEWVPTRYSRESYDEWFAELVMVRCMKPALLTDEVKAWIASVWA